MINANAILGNRKMFSKKNIVIASEKINLMYIGKMVYRGVIYIA
jgi:hypothetical protein